MRVGLILLAAGASRRLGRPKQLLPYGQCTLLRHAAEAVVRSVCEPVIVVLGAERERCAAELEELPVHLTWNPRWEEGMAGSIQAGLDALITQNRQISAAVICLCDQPKLSTSVLNGLVERHVADGSPIVASDYGGILGAPALFDASEFTGLRALAGDAGARRLFGQARERVATVPFPGGTVDIDTEEQYTALLSRGEMNQTG